jgi:hypothetical protein
MGVCILHPWRNSLALSPSLMASFAVRFNWRGRQTGTSYALAERVGIPVVSEGSMGTQAVFKDRVGSLRGEGGEAYEHLVRGRRSVS